MALEQYSQIVFVPTQGPEPVMVIVRELRSKGLVQGTDFDFKYNPKEQRWDILDDDGELSFSKAAGAHFYFADGKWATFFRMKYGDNEE